MGDGGAGSREKPMAIGAAVPGDYVAIRSIPSVSRCSIPRARLAATAPPHTPSPPGSRAPAHRTRLLPTSRRLTSREARLIEY